MHTSASLALNESWDPDVRDDMEMMLNKIVPEGLQYRHSCEGPDDMPAHVKACFLGSSLTIPITDGKLNLGTWQGVWLCEHRNHAGSRKLVINNLTARLAQLVVTTCCAEGGGNIVGLSTGLAAVARIARLVLQLGAAGGRDPPHALALAPLLQEYPKVLIYQCFGKSFLFEKIHSEKINSWNETNRAPIPYITINAKSVRAVPETSGVYHPAKESWQ
ncbi:UPF0047 protein C4A8.02c [Eumeta japonica]|uniref:UPF0047 protein C4A8.02c n=1 Tax=Eumeta variegata TaxID=151549 RepID=A0A4C1UUK4_EUMVA|nr:UPF0047 protein C4A8.02c [Eumeta japonica]